ncbi:Golgi to ER traffic protein 4 homolog [Microplitis demolitor]|uniref:Golgi to ER traffic protein 4 homolog n=1 Tax=Microplitis demolitor TaxID=69319 RepID=UPI0004CD525F|nr:Golgi to ER traffic protein 4 homolog [Microplitis demolitor]XP_008554603.1 Golgi to ER traffic protein 4 homolog [Microplitis demolitor]
MASRSNQGIQRVLGKLEASVNSGNYYEAHQMYRTLYFRYLAKKKYTDLLELLYNGAILLLQRDQHASGADLGILFVDVLNRSETPEPGIYFEKITNLFSIMKPGTPERESFLHNALRWSLKHTNCKWGHPDLHKMIAQVFWQEKNYTMARQHFVYSDDGAGCAAMLVELHQQRGYSNEVDLFIAQVVLQYLCLHNAATAQEAFDSYTSQHPKINSEPPYLLPLLNFLFFLLKTIQLSSLAGFTVLCEQYQLSLNRDPSYRTYLDKIAQLFFDVPAPRPRRQGLFGSILQSLFNGLEDDESDAEEQTSRQASNNASTSHAIQELD